MAVHLSKDEIQYILDNVDKKSTREMADWIGCNVHTVCNHLQKRGIKRKIFSMWSPQRLEEMLSLRREGMSYKELAEHFKVSESAIFNQLRTMRRKGVDVPTQWDARIIKKRNMEDFKECVGRQIEILDACGNVLKTVTVAKMKHTPQGIVMVDTDGDIYTEDELNLRYCLPPAYALFSFLKDQALLDEDTEYDANRYNNMFEDLMSMLERQGVIAKAVD